MDFFEEINSSYWSLELLSLEETECNSLTFEIAGNVRGSNASLDHRTKYLFKFDWYSSYCVINEMYNDLNDVGSEEEWIGKLFCKYSRSNYLDYIRKDTRTEAHYDFERVLKHCTFYTLNQTVHVTFFDEPEVKRIIAEAPST